MKRFSALFLGLLPALLFSTALPLAAAPQTLSLNGDWPIGPNPKRR